jgi:starch synthase
MSPEGIIAAVRRALELFRRGPDALSAVRSRGMAERFSWDEAAAQYLEVYEGALGRLTERKRSRRSLLRRF